MIIDTNPEFGIELTLVTPYAYWLHKQGKLEKVITSKGMKPFYYFCDDVEEKYNYRTVNNQAAGLSNIPNDWIYGTRNNALLYKDEWEDWNGKPPTGYFDIECLYNIFTYLTSKGYAVVYKRPTNTEFPLDQNEMNTLANKENLLANIEGVGVISDHQLALGLEDVYLLEQLNTNNLSYNELQINYFTNAKGFITMGGGSTLFPCFFQKPTVAYYGGTLTEINRKDFWEDSNGNKNIKNYHYMINPNLVPFIDKNSLDMENKYQNFINLVKNTFS